MIYMTGTDGFRLIVLESVNIDRIKEGKPAVTPDMKTLVAWTPDPVWLAMKVADLGSGDVKEIARLIDEAAKRPQKPFPRPAHETYVKTFLPKGDSQ